MYFNCCCLQFHVDWEECAIRTVNTHGSKSESKGDFAIKVTTLVEAGSNTGYLCTVKRHIDKEERYCKSLIDL